jgi:hypothetical protein
LALGLLLGRLLRAQKANLELRLLWRSLSDNRPSFAGRTVTDQLLKRSRYYRDGFGRFLRNADIAVFIVAAVGEKANRGDKFLLWRRGGRIGRGLPFGGFGSVFRRRWVRWFFEWGPLLNIERIAPRKTTAILAFRLVATSRARFVPILGTMARVGLLAVLVAAFDRPVVTFLVALPFPGRLGLGRGGGRLIGEDGEWVGHVARVTAKSAQFRILLSVTRQ